MRLIPIVCLVLAAPTAFTQDLGTEAQRTAGKALYDEKCSQCHGPEGAGDGVGAPFFRPAPRDFTAGTYKFRTSASGELPLDEDMRRSIRNGMPYTGMPAWPDLSDEEIQNLVYYLKTFNDYFDGPYGNPEAVTFTDEIAMSEESIARGRVVYEENQCLDCHGELGRGDGKSAPTLEDQWGVHIRPADLTKRWTFRGGSTRRDIYRTFTTGLDGSPMPSYSIDPPEDQWHLVNYVYSLSRDEPEYGTVVVASGVEGAISVDGGAAQFEQATPAYFPVVGQVIEPGRSFYPGVNGIEVRAIYNAETVGLMLSWHDMMANTDGTNAPTLDVPDSLSLANDTTVAFSDAVAVQFPTEPPEGLTRPYFLFGDPKRSVDLWFVDLASDSATVYLGRGRADLSETNQHLSVGSHFEDGRWEVILTRQRTLEGGTVFAEDAFVPIAFSVWDGFYGERGLKRGVTSWYHVYMSPLEVESPVGDMVLWGFGTFILGIGIVFLVRRKYGQPA
jgi:cytochrome c oxidase cbb3-type subunit 2